MVAGPWFHGEWQAAKGDSIGIIPFGGHETSREFRENIEAPFFRYYLHDKGQKPAVAGQHFSERIERLAHLSRVAAKRSQGHEPLPARGRHAIVYGRQIPNPARTIANTFLIPPIQSLIARVPFRRRIPRVIGAPGKSPTSASSIIARTCSPSSARHSTTISPSPGRSLRNCSPQLPARTATSWSS